LANHQSCPRPRTPHRPPRRRHASWSSVRSGSIRSLAPVIREPTCVSTW